MNNFKKNKRFGGERFERDSRGSFGRSGGKDFGRKNEMHQAICADCQKPCEVPFKPNGKKPVYCKDCFAKNGGQVSNISDFQKRPFKPSYDTSRSYSESQSSGYTSKPYTQPDEKKSDGLSKQLEIMNAKFDKLIMLIEALVPKSNHSSVSSDTVLPEFFAPTEKSEKPLKPKSKKFAGKKK